MNELYEKMKKIEGEYLQPQNFKQYKNYGCQKTL